MAETETTNTREYAPITEVNVTNFMSVRSGTIQFDESGVIKVLGYNNSGKSAMLRAMAVALMYRWPTKHKQFIMDDARYFQVDVNFADGVTIRFEKHASGTSLYEMYKNSELFFTTKISEGNYQKIVGVPEIIENYLGILSTPDGVNLTYGVNTDKQLLVETTGSENYQALNTVLKSDELNRAVQLINKDNNSLSAEISNVSATLTARKEDLNRLRDLDDVLVIGTQRYDDVIKDCESTVTALETIYNTQESYNSIPSIPQIPQIDISKSTTVQGIAKISKEIQGIELVPQIPIIDGEKLTSINRVANVYSEMSEIPDIPVIPEVDATRLDAFVNLAGIANECIDVERELKSLTEQKSEIEFKSRELVTSLRADGHVITQCPSCGEVHLADV